MPESATAGARMKEVNTDVPQAESLTSTSNSERGRSLEAASIWGATCL